MNVEVRYFTRSGNTEKVARAIAKEVGAEAYDLSVPLGQRADILFLGSSLYAGGVDKAVKSFINEHKDSIGVIYNFSTAASPSSTYNKVKKIAQTCGIKMGDKEFRCRGKFAFMNRSHPDDNDLENARAFAREVLKDTRENNG